MGKYHYENFGNGIYCEIKMKKFKIHIDADSYIWENGKIDDFGKIYIQLDEYDFPDLNWTDFGRTIIGWWINAFYQLETGEKSYVQCDFMDGSYRFDVSIIDSENWSFKFIEEKADSEEIWEEGICRADQAIENLLQAAEIIVRLYNTEGNVKATKNYEELMKLLASARTKNTNK